MAEKLNNFERINFQPCSQPLDDWPDALDHLAIGLVANKYTKLGKTCQNLLLSQGLSYKKIPL